MNTASAREEGKAAAMFGFPVEANPYRNEIARIQHQTRRDADSRLYELAGLWDSGHASAAPEDLEDEYPELSNT